MANVCFPGQKRRRADDTIPSLSPVTDIPIVNHAYYANSLPPKISPQKVAGVSLLKPLSERAKLKLGKLSPGLECLDAVPDTRKHHIEGASGVDIHLDQVWLAFIIIIIIIIIMN